MPNQHFRSLEDIEKDKKELIDEINGRRNTVEEEISGAVSKLNNSLEAASDSLNRSISIFKDKAKKAKAEFYRVCFITIIIIIYLIMEIFTYYVSESSVPSDSSISSYSYIKSLSLLIPFIAVIVISYLTIRVNRNISSIDNSSELDKEIENIDINKFKAPEKPSYPQNTESEKSFFDEKKALLSSLITAWGNSVPVVSSIYEEATLLAKYQKMVEDFEICVLFYNLVKDKEKNKRFFENLRKYAPAEAHIKNDEKLWKDIIVKEITSELNRQNLGQNVTVSENILMLLYYEHNDDSSSILFNKILSSEKEIQELASILILSQRLIKFSGYENKIQETARTNDSEYKKEDIIAIIREVESFSLSNINSMLSESFFVLTYLKSYIEFLEKNNINIYYKPTIDYIIEEGKKDIPIENNVVNLAYDLGLRNFNKINDLNKDYVDGFARASVTLKFHDDLSLRTEVCKCSAKEYSTAILWSYFEKIKENDGQEIVLINELIYDKERVSLEKVDLVLNKLKDPDIQFFQTQLKEGHWHDSSFSLLRKFFEDTSKEVLEKLSNAKEYEILKESIQSSFREVNIGTIEKLIDAQFFGAYVIMFNSGRSDGSDKNNEDKDYEEKKSEERKNVETLQKIIDYLSERDLNQSGDDKWKFKDKDKINKELVNTCGLRPKYDFINFSHSTRIGILGKDQSFQDFKDEFLKDIRTILNSRNEKFNVGIVVLKIMPSTYSFGTLDNDRTSDNIQVKDLDAVKYIARLASTKLPLEDQVSAMKFEKNIDLLKIVDKKSFYEIIKLINDDIDDKEKLVLEKPELIKQLLYELNENMSIKDFKSLSIDLKEEYYDERTTEEIRKIVESVLIKTYSNTPGLIRKAKSRPKLLSNRFVKSLKNLAVLYKLQKCN